MADFSRGKFQSLLTFATLAELQTAGDYNHNQLGLLVGTTSPGDGTFSFYLWDSESTAADTSGGDLSVIKATGVDKGRWLAQTP